MSDKSRIWEHHKLFFTTIFMFSNEMDIIDRQPSFIHLEHYEN